MTALDQMKEYSDHVLCGLKADDALKGRILQKAASSGQKHPAGFLASIKPLPVLCSLALLLLIGIFSLNGKSPVSTSRDPKINTFAAGRSVYSVALFQSSLTKCLDSGFSSICEQIEKTL